MAWETGRRDAWRRFKLAAPAATNATVKSSPLLSGKASDPGPISPGALPPTDPHTLKQVFNQHEQGRTRLEPPKKVAEEKELRLCGTCRKERHYGPCKKPPRTSMERLADFNLGLRGDDPQFVGHSQEGPSTSPHYHSATSDSALARARDGRPADETANTGFMGIDTLRGMLDPASEPGRMYGGLVKQQSWSGVEGHSLYEHRGPSVNPYEERLTRKGPPVGFGDEGKQRIERAFDQVDGAVDSTGLEGATGSLPADGPVVLG